MSGAGRYSIVCCSMLSRSAWAKRRPLSEQGSRCGCHCDCNKFVPRRSVTRFVVLGRVALEKRTLEFRDDFSLPRP